MSALRDLILDAFKQADKVLLALCVAASSYGVILIYSASRYKVVLHSMPIKQAIMMCGGIVLYFAVSQFNIDILRQHWKLVTFGSFCLMALLKTPLKVSQSGNTAWISIPGTGLTIQPAELVKILFCIVLAHQLAYLKRQWTLNRISSIVLICVTMGFFAGIVVLFSKDFGSALIFVSIFVFMVWGSGLSKLWFALAFSVIGAAIRVVWPMIPDGEVHKARILVLFEENPDPRGIAMQQLNGMAAIRSGGLFGQGYLHGYLTQHTVGSRLPERTNDFIFATCCEEWGLFGAAVVILLLTAILIRILYIGFTCNDTCHSLICFGFVGMFFAQIGFNLGMCLFVMPVIGVTLPFFSAGGTSLVVNFMIMGLISGIRSRSYPEWVRNTETPDEMPHKPKHHKPRNHTTPQHKSVLYTPGNKRRIQR